jgi:hypothetical protein
MNEINEMVVEANSMKSSDYERPFNPVKCFSEVKFKKKSLILPRF